MGLINNKEKQAAAGNWGHPRKWLKKHTKISDPLIPQRTKGKRKKKIKKIWVWKACPFCGKEIPIDKNYISTDSLVFFKPRLKYCECGAKIDECPCCKKETWLKDDIYKHYKDMFSCGFVGKKLRRKNEDI